MKHLNKIPKEDISKELLCRTFLKSFDTFGGSVDTRVIVLYNSAKYLNASRKTGAEPFA